MLDDHGKKPKQPSVMTQAEIDALLDVLREDDPEVKAEYRSNLSTDQLWTEINLRDLRIGALIKRAEEAEQKLKEIRRLAE